MDEETISKIKDYLDKKRRSAVCLENDIRSTVDYVLRKSRYIGYLVLLGVYLFKRIKVGLDYANRVPRNIAKIVFDASGTKTYIIKNIYDSYNIR